MFKKIMLVLALLLISLQVFALERQIPLMFGYQGALIDEGGNPLPDGPTDMKFRILDSVGNVLYEESQNLDMIKGEVFAIIGNGLSPVNGSPMGGIPLEVFDPVDTKYLQVLVDGQMPFDKLEIVTAPYALWADTALHMPDGAITSAMIGKGVITKDHLNAELISAIFPGGIPKDMLPSDTMYGNEIQDVGGASKIGVTSQFLYSSSSTVQGVLKDLDVAIKKRSEEFVWAKNDYGTKITNETATRIAADTALKGDITNEANARISADNALQTNGAFTTPTIVGGTISNTTEISSPSVAPIGSIVPFYDFGGKLTFNQSYWKYCDGSSYDFGGAIGVQTLPDLSGRYLVGFGTDGGGDLAGAAWNATAVGNAGHLVDLSHTHTGPNHTHGAGTLQFRTGESGLTTKFLYRLNGDKSGIVGSYTSAQKWDGVSGKVILTDPSYPPPDASDYYTQPNTGTGLTGLAGTGATGSTLSTTQSIQPRSVRVRYIMRVK